MWTKLALNAVLLVLVTGQGLQGLPENHVVDPYSAPPLSKPESGNPLSLLPSINTAANAETAATTVPPMTKVDESNLNEPKVESRVVGKSTNAESSFNPSIGGDVASTQSKVDTVMSAVAPTVKEKFSQQLGSPSLKLDPPQGLNKDWESKGITSTATSDTASMKLSEEKTWGGQGGDKKKITIVSVCSGSALEYCDVSEKNHKEYATSHGYKYNMKRGDGGLSIDKSKWSKLEHILDNFEGADYVMWLDADAVFTNKGKSIEEVFRNNNFDNDMLIARDAWYNELSYGGAHKTWYANSGVMMFKTNEWSKNFLQTIIQKGEVQDKGEALGLVDQPRICLELIERGELQSPPTSLEEKHTHVTIVRPKVMNAFMRFWKGDVDPWQRGDFIGHATGIENKMRLQRFREADQKSIFANTKFIQTVREFNDKSKAGPKTQMALNLLATGATPSHALSLIQNVGEDKLKVWENDPSSVPKKTMDEFELKLTADVLTALDAGDVAKVDQLTQMGLTSSEEEIRTLHAF